VLRLLFVRVQSALFPAQHVLTMRIIKSIHGADGAGTYGMIAEDGEDMWCAYNLIETGDKVSASTIRKVAKEGAAPGAASERIRTKLTVEVISAGFDPESASVRVAGRNAEENTWVRMGAHHTIELELHHPFYIEKTHWDSVHLKRLHEARDTATAQADVAAVVMDLGLANVCLLTDRMTIVRAKIEMPIPKKRPGASGHEKALNRFHDAVLSAIRRVVDFEKVKAVILASPGFVREDFFNYMMEESGKICSN
jgi:protein pelota